MSFIVLFDGWIPEEVIIRSEIQSSLLSPFHILQLPPKFFPVVTQWEYQPNFMLSCFSDHKIQCLNRKEITWDSLWTCFTKILFHTCKQISPLPLLQFFFWVWGCRFIKALRIVFNYISRFFFAYTCMPKSIIFLLLSHWGKNYP